MLDHRIFHIIKKEMIQLLRDKRFLVPLFIAPIIQLFIFGYVATTEIKNIPTAVFDQDKTFLSREFISSFKTSSYFNIKQNIYNIKEGYNLLDGGAASVVINIPSGFAKKIRSGKKVNVQFLLDGSDSNSASIALGYINGIVFQNTFKIMQEKFKNYPGLSKKINLINVKTRIYHNQGLKSANFFVPAIIATLMLILTSVFTSMAIVKEKEYGTLEQIIVSPIKPYELMIGKTVPFIIVLIIILTLVLNVARFWFQVPILGSVWLLSALSVLFLLTSLGIGLFISTVSQTMQQTILSIIFIMIPSIILSGFIFPIENMPEIIQWITLIIPMRYFLVIVRSIFLKGVGIEYLWGESFALLILGAAIFYLAVKKFKKRLE